MAGHNDKRRMLDDEMSRFEAEISGPTAMDSDQNDSVSSDMDLRPIIGSSTFAQVKEKLSKDNDEDELPPPPMPPSFSNGSKARFGSPFGSHNQTEPLSRERRPMGHPDLGPPRMPGPPGPPRIQRSSGPQRMPGPGMQRMPGPHGPQGPGPFGPRPPHGFNQGQFRPCPPGPGNFGPNMGPRGEPPVNSFPPPPPPPGFMGHHGRGGGGNNFHPPGMAPPRPPPGFIPPQVNRMTNMGPAMSNGNHMGPSMGPRPPPSFLRPPPPPPGLLGQRVASTGSLKSNSSTANKTSAVISSAPKLYVAQAKDKDEVEESTLVAVPTLEIKRPNPPSDKEPKKKRQKIEQKPMTTPQNRLDMSQAVEMAEKVKQSVTTIKQSVNPVHHHPGSGAPPEERKREKRSRKNLRYAGGQIWEDINLAEWDPDDFRMFAGDLGNDVTDELLHRYFSHYPSFAKAKVVRDKRTNKSKGYGFISFKDSQDYIRAMKEMNGKYLGSRPIKLRKSMWRDRNLDVVQKKLKEKQLSGLK